MNMSNRVTTTTQASMGKKAAQRNALMRTVKGVGGLTNTGKLGK